MIVIPNVVGSTDLLELRQTISAAAIEAGLSATDLARMEGAMIEAGDDLPPPMISNTGFSSLLASPPRLGTGKVLRARLVVKASIEAAATKKAIETAAREA